MGNSPSLDRLEGRLSVPDYGLGEILPWLIAFIEEKNKKKLKDFGIVFHFQRVKKTKERNFSAQRFFIRHGGVRKRARMEARKVFRILSRPNPIAPFVCGLDVASMELPTPPDVFAPTYRFLRKNPILIEKRSEIRSLLGLEYLPTDAPPNPNLRMTYHVGEDFRHLFSGLRAIDEVVQFLAPDPGDRLGHAIALGISPRVWGDYIGWQTVLPKQEWLDNLVWVQNLLGPNHALVEKLKLNQHICTFFEAIYGEPIRKSALREKKIFAQKIADWKCSKEGATPFDGDLEKPSFSLFIEDNFYSLSEAWLLRQLDPYSVSFERLKEGKLDIIEDPSFSRERQRWYQTQKEIANILEKRISSANAYRYLLLYWHNKDVFDRGNELLFLDMRDKKELWLELLQEVQARMLEIVVEERLVVEANPSSNWSIGPMQNLDDHHIFNLTLDQKNQLEPKIQVTVNTDNPGVFSTSLAHEFYLLGEVLLKKGVAEPEVVKWLEWLRENGQNSTFLESAQYADDGLWKKETLEKLRLRIPSLAQRITGTRDRVQAWLDTFIRETCEDIESPLRRPFNADQARMIEKILKPENLELLLKMLNEHESS